MKKAMLPSDGKKELTSLALNIEFLVISVIQGMALQLLASNILPVIGESKFVYMLYAISGFILILIFWSQSIIHALSFIDWPINLIHTFLYFLASLIEVITFSYITNPLRWFQFSFIFLIITGILYLYDFSMIKQHKADSEKNTARKKLYNHIYAQQLIEMKFFLPLALIFNAVAVYLLSYHDTVLYSVILGGLQVIFSLILLVISLHSFKIRSHLITEAFYGD